MSFWQLVVIIFLVWFGLAVLVNLAGNVLVNYGRTKEMAALAASDSDAYLKLKSMEQR